MYEELKAKALVLSATGNGGYGTYEFVIEDVDGR